MSSEFSAKDFLSRNEIARATALTGKQSSTLSSFEELEIAIAKKQS